MHLQNSNDIFDRAEEWSKSNLPFVLFCYPNDTLIRGVFQINDVLHQMRSFEDSGFIFSPFDCSRATIIIKGDFFQTTYETPEVVSYEENGSFEPANQKDKDSHVELVGKAISEIRKGNLEKVVVSRCMERETSRKPRQIFEALLEKYSSAFCYWWYHPNIGMWFGATPERLLNYKDNSIAMTSLAATLPIEEGLAPNWSSKEIEEQKIVTDYISDIISPYSSNIKIQGPEDVKAGKLWHLKTEISANLKSSNDLSYLIKSLHPTPAVAGIPKTKAIRFIENNEGYDREFYTGYLGSLNLEKNNETNLFVNLRCLQYSEGLTKIYVGGGITLSSSIEGEWRETQFKSRTILEVL